MKKIIESIFCPYEIAIEMKKLNFNEECLAYYIPTKRSGHLYYQEYGGEAFDMNQIKTVDGHECVSAPTWDQLFNWLRDNHKMEIKIEPAGEKDIYPKWMFMGVEDLNDYMSGVQLELSHLSINYEDMIMYDTYDECRLVAVNETLKLMKI